MTQASQPSGEEQALEAARELVDSGAPWRRGVSWQLVLGEGAVLAVVGALIWLPPGVGGTAILQLLGVTLLLTASVSAYRLLRAQVAPRSIAPVAFRAGVGLTVGLLVIIGSLVAEQVDVATLALAIVLGIGFVLYGLSVVAATAVGRQAGDPLPVAALVLAVGAVAIGVVLVLRANDGIEALSAAFGWLGAGMLVVGLLLAGWALYLRSRDVRERND